MAPIEQLVKSVEKYVTGVFEQNPRPNLLYHNIRHTRQVVEAVGQIAAHYQLKDEELLVVHTAAWFHDLGYLFVPPVEHERKGAELAETYMKEQNLHPSLIEQTKGCILATRMPQNPRNLLEEIVCDADLFHLGTEAFSDYTKVIRKEKELLSCTKIGGQTWREGTLLLLKTHRYFTEYCQALLRKGKEENIKWLKAKMQEKKEEEQNKDETNEEKQEEDKAKRPTRGVETMFRLTSTNHLELSAMADSKANIMISVNAIIVSVLLSVMLRRLEEFPNLVIPTFIFLMTSVLTMVFAILATRPNVNMGTFTQDDIQKKRTNLLFFGNFHRMKLDEYEWAMKELIKDREYLYNSLIRDIYFLGVVLGRKYKLLRITYNIFMFGFVLSVVAFGVAIFFFPSNN